MDYYVFFLICLGWTYFWWGSFLMAHCKLLKNPFPGAMHIGGFGPMITASYLTYQQGGQDALNQFFSKLYSYNAIFSNARILYLSVLIPFVGVGVAFLIQSIHTSSLPSLFPLKSRLPLLIKNIAFTLLIFVANVLLIGGEEVGWRGYAFPQMIAAGISPLYASLSTGFIWGIWHFPIFFAKEHPLYLGDYPVLVLLMKYSTYVLSLTFLAVPMGHLSLQYPSLLSALFYHASFNSSFCFFYGLEGTAGKSAFAYTMVSFAILTLLSETVITL